MATLRTSNSASNVTASQRDAVYYLTPVIFKVEGTLFKVPRNSLMNHSPTFHDMFALPQDSSTNQEGSVDDLPIELPVSKSDFRYLLKVLYPLELPPAPELPEDGWVAVLKLSNFWEMDRVRELAIKELTRINPDSIEKIILAKTYHVPQWLRTGYQELVSRAEMLSMDDCEAISYLSAIGVFRIRESNNRPNINRGNIYNTYARALSVDEVFKDELAAEEAIHLTYTPRATVIHASRLAVMPVAWEVTEI